MRLPGGSSFLLRASAAWGRLSLASRLLVWILPVFLAAAAAVSASAWLIARAVLLREVEQEARVLTEVAATHAAAFAAQRDNDLATIGHSPLFKDYAANVAYGLGEEAEVYRRELERMLLSFSERTGVYPRLRYLDAAGREVCRVQEGRVAAPSDKADARLLRGLRPGLRLSSGLERVPWHPSPVVESRQGFYDEGGALRGVLVFDYSLDRVYQVLGRLRVGETGRSYLLDDPRRAPPDLGPGVVTAAMPVPGTPWRVATVARRAEFLERLRWVGELTLLLALATVALIFLAVTQLVRSLLRPIGALAAAADAYAAGDLDARVSRAGSGEVRALAEAFNTMAGSLKQRTEDLRQRVRELTALQNVNEAALRRLGRDALARVCLEAALKGLGFERGALFWVEGREAVGACASGMEAVGLTDEELRRRRVPLDGGDILAHVVRRREAILVADAREDPRCDPAFTARVQARSFCAAPIVARGEVVAVIALCSPGLPGPVPAEKLPGVALFTGAAGLALENARLLGEVTASEARYRTTVENSPDAIVGLDQAMRVTLWNRRAETLFGWQPAEARGRELDFVLGPEAYQALRRRLETEGAVRQADVEGLTRAGDRLSLCLSWSGRDPGPGAAREWFVVIQDVTERRRLQARLLQAEKLTAIGSLMAGVAHELNNPLGSILGFAELLRWQPSTPRDRDDLRLIHDNALRCRDIVRGLLFFARKGRVERGRVSLNEVAKRTLALMEYRLVKAEGIKLELELDAARPEVAGDARRLQQVLVNLLTNAADALEGRPGPRAIAVRTRRAPDACRLTVEDTGPGVPASRRQRLFEPFYTTKPVGRGTGLGLSVSREIAVELGGDLRYEEAPGGGARFELSFPPCPEDVAAAAAPPDLPPPAPGLRALIVDDEPEQAQLMRRLLAEDGFDCAATADGSEALRLVREEPFDLVVADLDLGPLRGTRLIEAAGEAPRRPAVVLVTGDVLNRSLEAALAEPRALVVAKPFLRSEFLRAVRRALETSRT